MMSSMANAARVGKVILLLFLVRPAHSLGSCKEAGLCCTGRDASCVVQKTPQNAIIEDLRDTPCYCDHACLKLNDCCPDYRQTCGGKHPRSIIHFFFSSYLFLLFNFTDIEIEANDSSKKNGKERTEMSVEQLKDEMRSVGNTKSHGELCG